jgi:phage baseplate assembly protein W
MSNIIKKYSDLDLNFTPHPTSGDIIPLKDADAVKRSLKNLLFTNKHERLFNPNIGANLNSLLFEPISVLAELNIKLLIEDLIKLYEPRITTLNVEVKTSSDENGYDVTISFIINDISQTTSLNLFLERLR